MSISFWVGEQPTDPMIVTVLDADGTARDLTEYDSITFIGDPLPAGAASINNAALGRVQYDFSAPFTTAGSLVIQVQLDDDGTDLSSPFTIEVKEFVTHEDLRVTPSQVWATTNVSVSDDQIARAQNDIILFTGVPLNDDEVWDDLSASYQGWYSLAIGYQAAWRTEGGSGTLNVPNAKTVKSGDVTITWGSAVTTTQIELAPLARVALSRINSRTLHATPFIASTRVPMRPLWVEYHV